jgi:hypothetical protein
MLMKKTTDGVNSLGFAGQQDTAGSIHLDLLSLIRRIQTSVGLGELAMATAGRDDEENADFFILDDVTPRYATVNAALNACHAALGEALCHLLEAKISSAPPRVVRAA